MRVLKYKSVWSGSGTKTFSSGEEKAQVHKLQNVLTSCWRYQVLKVNRDGCNKGGREFSHFCWLKQEVNGGRDPTTNRQNKCWHCALCTNHGLPFSFFAALLHKGLKTSPGVLKMIRCVTWSAAGHVVRNNWNHGCIFCHFIYYLTFYSSGKMTCLAVSCFMERSLCWDIFLTTCWYLLGMERIKEETSELYFCSRLFSFFLLFFEIQSRTNSTASLNNTEYILCSSSLLQYNLNVHLLDTHYSPTWSNGYESIGLTKKGFTIFEVSALKLVWGLKTSNRKRDSTRAATHQWSDSRAPNTVTRGEEVTWPHVRAAGRR